MNPLDIALASREVIADGTMAFHFAKPAGFSFKPGQAIELLLIDPPGTDEASARHAFSLVSAPYEDRLTIATRMRDSAFKNALKALPLGALIRLEGPFGSLTLHNNRARPAVFIAGGIGITPFISILRQATLSQLPQDLALLYSSRRPEDTAFLDELKIIKKQNKRFRLSATMTQMSKSSQPWAGHIGAIDRALLKQVTNEMTMPIYYVAGPPALVETMHQTLNHAGVDDDDIRSEEFYGY